MIDVVILKLLRLQDPDRPQRDQALPLAQIGAKVSRPSQQQERSPRQVAGGRAILPSTCSEAGDRAREFELTHNDVLRRLRYALNIPNFQVVELFKLAEYPISPLELEGYFKKEDEPGYIWCPDQVMGLFLKGLIASKRGKREENSSETSDRETRLTNNDILKSLRIALELKDEEIISILRLAEAQVSKSELSALFRKKGHPNHRECGDQFLRNFLTGLTIRNKV